MNGYGEKDFQGMLYSPRAGRRFVSAVLVGGGLDGAHRDCLLVGGISQQLVRSFRALGDSPPFPAFSLSDADSTASNHFVNKPKRDYHGADEAD